MVTPDDPGSVAALFLTVRQAALRIGVSVPTVYRLMNGGWIPSVKIGRARRISVQALRSFAAAVEGGELQIDSALKRRPDGLWHGAR